MLFYYEIDVYDYYFVKYIKLIAFKSNNYLFKYLYNIYNVIFKY